MAEKLRLAPHERANPLWVSLERHMRKSLAELRALNDTSLPPDRTEHIRGRIAQLKALLALADEPQQPPT
jgi:hypothetical protein